MSKTDQPDPYRSMRPDYPRDRCEKPITDGWCWRKRGHDGPCADTADDY